MLIELDLIAAIAALALAMPVPIYIILGGGAVSASGVMHLGQSIALGSGLQRLAFQLSGISGQPANISRVLSGSGYALRPYNASTGAAPWAGARLVVVDGNLRYIGVSR